jgi:hypothetical protein
LPRAPFPRNTLLPTVRPCFAKERLMNTEPNTEPLYTQVSAETWACLTDNAKERAQAMRREAVAAALSATGRWISETVSALPRRRTRPSRELLEG